MKYEKVTAPTVFSLGQKRRAITKCAQARKLAKHLQFGRKLNSKRRRKLNKWLAILRKNNWANIVILKELNYI